MSNTSIALKDSSILILIGHVIPDLQEFYQAYESIDGYQLSFESRGLGRGFEFRRNSFGQTWSAFSLS